ncbi:MAG: TonB family protein [Sphingopyxis sp.]|nr:TonB family protein [Sphingopyxis sp.]
MTLIPLISSILAAPEATTARVGASAVLPRNSYGSDNRRHPVAALLAVGLPVAMVAAVALSPMIIVHKPISDPSEWTSVILPTPQSPEPKADPQTQKKTVESPITTVKTPFKPVTPDSTFTGPERGYELPAGPGTGTAQVLPEVVELPAPPKLVLAQLDQRYMGVFQPDYPARAQREGIEGIAIVRVLIGTDGRVKAVELVSADDPAFFEATKRRALAKWRFKAATRGGVPEESWKEMRVRFEIKNA